MYDFRNPKKLQNKNSLLKLTSILKVLWIWVSIGHWQSRYGVKGISWGLVLQTSYKREGGGYHCDAGGEDFYHHCNALNLLPRGRQVEMVTMQFPNLETNVFMDSWCNSSKLFIAAYHSKTLYHGVVRNWGRGVPSHVIINKEKYQKEADKLSGLSKAAVLRDDLDCLNFVCCSVHDSKPVIWCLQWQIALIRMRRQEYLVNGAGMSCWVKLSFTQLHWLQLSHEQCRHDRPS